MDGAWPASPDVQILGDGLVGLRGDLLALFVSSSVSFANWRTSTTTEGQSLSGHGAERVSRTSDISAISRSHITFCSHLPGSLPVLESVAKSGQWAESLENPSRS